MAKDKILENKEIYFDNAATTKPFAEVIAKMADSMQKNYGNPSSLHHYGLAAKDDLNIARKQVADLISAHYDEIYFTSGGTESDNLAIWGSVIKHGKGHIITSAVEHHAVLDTVKNLQKRGFDITILGVDDTGMVSADELKNAMREDTLLVSIMQANNEVGTINPIKELTQIAHEHGALMHVDAVQSLGKIDIDVKDLDIDLMSISAHKINGPKGCGALYKKKGLQLERMVYGGSQEKKLRSGTQNMPGICGMGMACAITKENMAAYNNKISSLKAYFIKAIEAEIPDIKFNGSKQASLPSIINISFKGIDGETLLLRLNNLGISCSAGSACSAGFFLPSHVLLAMGVDVAFRDSAIRFSLGHENTEKEVDYVMKLLKEQVMLLRNK